MAKFGLAVILTCHGKWASTYKNDYFTDGAWSLFWESFHQNTRWEGDKDKYSLTLYPLKTSHIGHDQSVYIVVYHAPKCLLLRVGPSPDLYTEFPIRLPRGYYRKEYSLFY